MNIKRLILLLILGIGIAVVGYIGITAISDTLAYAADRFWVGGEGDITDNGTHWSDVSGGAPGISLPTQNDDCYIDANSGSDFTITVDNTAYCLDLNFTGSDNVTLNGGSKTIRVYGDVVLKSDTTVTHASSGYVFSFRGTNTLTTNGVTIDGSILMDTGCISLDLLDELNCSGAYIANQYGTFTTNGNDIIAGGTIFTTSYATTRAVNLSSSYLYIEQWNATSITNLTFTEGTSNITAYDVFNGGGLTYYTVKLRSPSATINGNNTYTNLYSRDATEFQELSITDGTNQTVTNAYFDGNHSNLHIIKGTGTNGWTLTKAGGGTVNLTFALVEYSIGEPANTWYYDTSNGSYAVNTTGWTNLASIPAINTNDATGISMDKDGVISGNFTGNITDLGSYDEVVRAYQYGTSTGSYTLNTANISARFINASDYLTIPTYEGSNQTVHPSIVYFDTAWHGYKYWMAITPYPDGDETKENPSILASNDGQTWVVPIGLTNPVVPYPGVSGGINIDPNLFYDSDSDQLWLTWCNGSDLYRKESSNGTSWSSDNESILTYVGSFHSQCIEKVGSTYYLYYGSQTGSYNIKFRTSANGTTWGTEQSVNFTQTGYEPWHFSIHYIPSKSEYWMTVNCIHTGFGQTTTLFFAKSSDGINFTTYDRHILGKGLAGNWDYKSVYKTDYVYYATTDNLTIWYSANDGKNDDGGSWHTGWLDIDYSDFITLLETSNNSTGDYIVSLPSSLTPGASYYYRIASANDLGVSYGSEKTFTLTMPTHTTELATNAVMNYSGTTATLNSNISNMGVASDTYLYWEWGYNTSYGNTVGTSVISATGDYSTTITGFDPEQIIHFRAVVQNGSITSNGDDSTITITNTVAYYQITNIIPIIVIAVSLFVVIGVIFAPLSFSLKIILIAIAMMFVLSQVQGLFNVIHGLW